MKIAKIAREKWVRIDRNNVRIDYSIKFEPSATEWTDLHIKIGKEGCVYSENVDGKYEPVEKWMIDLINPSLAAPYSNLLFEYTLYKSKDNQWRYEVRAVGQYCYLSGDEAPQFSYEPLKNWDLVTALINSAGTRAMAFENVLGRKVFLSTEQTKEVADGKDLAKSNESEISNEPSEKSIEASGRQTALSSDKSTEDNTAKNVPPSIAKLPKLAQSDNNSSSTPNPSCASNSKNYSFLLKALLGLAFAAGGLLLIVAGIAIGQPLLKIGGALAGVVGVGISLGFFSRKSQAETHHQDNQTLAAAPI